MELVTIRTFTSTMEASFARSFLESNGIDVFLADEIASRIYGANSVLIGGVQLQVRAEDAELAQLLLAEARSVVNQEEE